MMLNLIKYSSFALALAAALPGAATAQEDWKVCGWLDVTTDYWRWFPCASNDVWFRSGAEDWNSLVMTDLSSYLVPRGETVWIRHLWVENRGTMSAFLVNLTIYLSTDTVITPEDRQIRSLDLGTFPGEKAWANQSVLLTIPPAPRRASATSAGSSARRIPNWRRATTPT